MTSLNNFSLAENFSSERRPMLLLVTVLGAAVLIGAIAAQQLWLALGVAVAVLLAFVIMAWPDASTLAIIFILYANLAVIAVRFHGVPQIVGTMVSALLAIPLAHYLIIRRQKVIINPALPVICLFLVIQVLSTLFSEYIDLAVSELMELVVEGVVLYFLINNLVRTQKMLRRAVWILLIAAIIMGGVPIYQQLTGTFDNNYWGLGQTSVEAFGTGVENLQGEVGQYRLAGPIGEQNRYAQVMLMLVPLGFFQIWSERSSWLRALAAIATAIAIIGGALAFSRGAAVAFVLLLVIMSFMRYIKPYQIVIILLGGVLLLRAMPQYGTRLDTLQALSSVTEENTAGIGETDTSTQSRVTEMLAAALVFADHPWLGVGPGVFGQYYEEYGTRVGIRVKLGRTRQAHSLFPGIAAESGGLGLITFLAFIGVTLRELAVARKRWLQSRPELAHMVTGFMLAIVSYLTTGIFLHFSFIRFFWLMFALAGAAAYVAKVEASTETTSNQALPDSSA